MKWVCRCVCMKRMNEDQIEKEKKRKEDWMGQEAEREIMTGWNIAVTPKKEARILKHKRQHTKQWFTAVKATMVGKVGMIWRNTYAWMIL